MPSFLQIGVALACVLANLAHWRFRKDERLILPPPRWAVPVLVLVFVAIALAAPREASSWAIWGLIAAFHLLAIHQRHRLRADPRLRSELAAKEALRAPPRTRAIHLGLVLVAFGIGFGISWSFGTPSDGLLFLPLVACGLLLVAGAMGWARIPARFRNRLATTEQQLVAGGLLGAGCAMTTGLAFMVASGGEPVLFAVVLLGTMVGAIIGAAAALDVGT